MPDARKLSEEWEARVSAVARNLTDFATSPDASRMRARLTGPIAYAGATARAAREAQSAIDGLWSDYLLVSKVVDEARALAKKPFSFAGRDEEVVRLLEGSSVRLPTTEIPVGRRALTGPAEACATMRLIELLDAMTARFAEARDTVAAVAEAERQVGLAAPAVRADTEDLRRRALAARLDAAPLDAVSKAYGAAMDDPVGAADGLGAAWVGMEAFRTDLEAREAAVAEVDTGFREARSVLLDLGEAVRAAGSEVEAADAVVARGDTAIPSTDDLCEWLDRIVAASGSDDLRAVSVGLDRWRDAARSRAKAIAAHADATRRALSDVEDLKGRLRALRAKRKALAPDAEPPVEAETRAAFAKAPFPLAEARRLLAAYEHALSALGREEKAR